MSEIPSGVLQEDFTLLAPAQLPVQASAAVQHGLSPAGYLAIAAAAVLLLFVLWRLWRRTSTRRAAEAAHAIALRELAVWKDMTDETRYRDAVAAISAILRRYMERRYGLPASSFTTEELWRAQQASGRIPQIHVPFWERLSAEGDPIKYAGLTPRAEQFQQLLAESVRFVEASQGEPAHE